MKNTFRQLTAAALLSMAILAAAPSALAQTSEKPYTYVEQMPVFKGGEAEMMKFLGSNINYPADAIKAGVEGLVVLSFVIDANGSVHDMRVVKSLSTSTDAEATRVAKMTDGKWQPGKQNGKTVAVQYTLPVRFAMKNAPADAAGPDQQPQFKGGQQALMRTINQHLKVPEEAKQEHLNARVVVKFTVEKDGTVSNIKLASTKLKKTVGPDATLDYMDASTFNLQNKTILAKLAEAAAAAVKATSGQWQPATKNGQAVAAELALPVQFVGSEAGGK
ncbi:TonB family protein [Pontibacter kalidii]|uniref:TonB family protein n=1 Tax=Pontibacter kalidii TaxID=2592049 RepID=UPI00224FF20A|nr:TonB family protein [Pontibacter kalidii]